jgi:uncharacterized membrane protein
MSSLEELLRRWTSSGIIDQATAQRIRAFERTREQPGGLRWEILLALSFGGILLAAGIILFVAAQWDQLSPGSRFALVLGLVAVLHGAAILVRGPFEKLAITLHGVGTMAAGAAIFLVGQIFNMQEHWPAGILLWALCAIAGWVLLGDQVQQTIAMLLVPAWILCDWWVRTNGYRGDALSLTRMLASFAALYLTAFIASNRRLVSGLLFTSGAIALTVAVVLLSQSWSYWYHWAATPAMPLHLTMVAWGWIVVVPLLVAWRLKPAAMLPVAAVIIIGFVLPHLFRVGRAPYYYPQNSVLSYVWVGLLACFFTWWGVAEHSRAILNYGIFAFAATVLWFYFSSVMDKLGRSLSLIVLGLLFLGGGWLLEKMRRRLVRHVMRAKA